MVKVAIIYYSMYGHIKKMADKIKEGAETVPGVTIDMFQVPETLPEEVLTMMHAAPKTGDPVMDREAMKTLPDYDGFIFGFPVRFGMMCSQFKSFLDGTGGLWMQGKLSGKPAALFCSAGTQHGGVETTLLTAVTQLTHHGMIYVPFGYGCPELFAMSEVSGGGPLGASTYAAGDGSRQPSDNELKIAFAQGAQAVTTFKRFAIDATASTTKPRIAVIYYSLLGHVKGLADDIKAGINDAGGEATLFQVPETLEVRGRDKIKAMFNKVSAKFKAHDGQDKVLEEKDIDSLADNFDGFIFGTPTRFGMMSTQLKAFFDKTGKEWKEGKFRGKPAAIFVSTGTQTGGSETTALTSVTQFAHHGMPFVPIGYTCPDVMDLTGIHGGTPYGATCIAGPDGSRELTDTEHKIAKHQGSWFTGQVKKVVASRAAEAATGGYPK